MHLGRNPMESTAIPTKYGATSISNKPNSDRRSAWSQIIAVLVNNVMLVSNGMVVGFPIILIPNLSQENLGTSSKITEDQISWMGSISFTCSLIGCIASGFITQPIGRTRSVQLVAPLLFLAWMIFQFASQVWHIYLALCLCGLTCSLVEAPILAYKSEVCEPNLRGMLSATSTLSVVTGTLIQIILGAVFHWRTAAVISSAFPAFTFVMLFFIPESPHWLIMHNKQAAAHVNLAWLRGWTTLESVEDELNKICSSYKINIQKSINDTRDTVNESKNLAKKIAPYTKKNFLWPLALMEFIFFVSHFTGNTTLQTYAVAIFATMRAPLDDFCCTIILGVTEVVGCLISLFFVRFYGKRIMTFVSLSGIGICNVAIGIYMYLIDVKYLVFNEVPHTNVSHFEWIPLCLLILLAFIGHCGIRVLPWVLLGEVFPHETRAVGCGLGSASYNLMIFLANKLFINMVNGFTIFGVYVFYSVISFVGILYLYIGLPETEGKNLEDVINHFSEVAVLDNKIISKNSKTANYNNIC